MVAADKRMKQQLAAKLQAVASATNDPRKKTLITNKLKSNPSLGELEDLLTLVGGPVANSRPDDEGSDDYAPTYLGNSPAYSLTENEQNDVLDIDEARKQYDPLIINKRRQLADAV
jgi:hypothetical protein